MKNRGRLQSMTVRSPAPLCRVNPSHVSTAVIVAVTLGLSLPAYSESPQPPAAAAPKSAITKIAFFQLEAQMVDPRIAGIVTDMFLGELSKMKDTRVIGSKEIDAMLGYEQKKQMSGCTDTSCMVAIGGALGVDKILMGSVGKIGASHTISLKLINIREGTVEEIFNKRIKGGTEEEFLDVIPEALAVVFPAHASNWVKTQKGAAAPPPPPGAIQVLDLQRTPPLSPSLPPGEGKGAPATPPPTSPPAPLLNGEGREVPLSPSGGKGDALLHPKGWTGDRGHAGQFLFSAKGVAAILEKGMAAEVGLGYGLGSWVELGAAALISNLVAVKPRLGVFVYNPDGALKPFVNVVVPVYFTPDGTMIGGGGGPGVQWDLTGWLGLTAEAAAEYYFSPPKGYRTLQLFGLAGVQARL